MIYDSALTLKGKVETGCQIKNLSYEENFELDGTGLNIKSVIGGEEKGVTIRTLLITDYDITSNSQFLQHYVDLIKALSRYDS